MKPTSHHSVCWGDKLSLARLTHVLLGLAMAVLGFAALNSALAQTYTITDLGTLGGDNSRALGINNKGMVVGSAGTHQTAGAFVWKPTVPNGTGGIMSEIRARALSLTTLLPSTASAKSWER